MIIIMIIIIWNYFALYISYRFYAPLIFFNNCLSARVFHYNMKPCFCNLTSKLLADEA
uniref:Uncharacterized protein n=1 Tax=Paramormyrops kingsleyae TaxID=1676925 RepID=A0A3B3R271_9TELE